MTAGEDAVEPDGDATRDRPDVAGVLLAAGAGTRFAGGNKLLQPVPGDGGSDAEPIVVRAGRTLVAALPRSAAVVGFEADRVRAALADAGLGLQFVENPDYAEGQSTSLRRGVAWARERDADAAVFALGDVPWVDPGTYEALLSAHEDGADLVVPTFEGRRGNPVLFGARYFEELTAVEGDTGGRPLFERHDVTRVPVDDPGIHRDVDTREDLPGE